MSAAEESKPVSTSGDEELIEEEIIEHEEEVVEEEVVEEDVHESTAENGKETDIEETPPSDSKDEDVNEPGVEETQEKGDEDGDEEAPTSPPDQVTTSGAEPSTDKGKTSCLCCAGKVFCVLLMLLLLAFLIVYGVRLGTGNEKHEAGAFMSDSCKAGSNSTSSISAITFNSYLIYCLGDIFHCEEESKRALRVKKITDWFKDRDEDVVFFQEVWSFHGELKEGMRDAGYCNYVTTTEQYGSGLAIFSKFPIMDYDFRDWFDAFGIGEGLAPDPTNLEVFVGDKGVLYAKIQKDRDTTVNLFNVHTNSDTSDDAHDVRIKQYDITREFVESKSIQPSELVILAGDFNEDKNCRENICEIREPVCTDRAYYKDMLNVLDAGEPALVSDQTFTYDTTVNKILQDKYKENDCPFRRLRLDYMLYSRNHLIPTPTSSCEIILAMDSDENELSDHFPLSCVFDYE